MQLAPKLRAALAPNIPGCARGGFRWIKEFKNAVDDPLALEFPQRTFAGCRQLYDVAAERIGVAWAWAAASTRLIALTIRAPMADNNI